MRIYCNKLGILTSVLDGHGYTSDTGAQGHRGYDEDIMFTWLGAAVDIPYKVHKTSIITWALNSTSLDYLR